MKTKVKESRKDIKIDIQIENNLMSKNKNSAPDDNVNTGKIKPMGSSMKNTPPISKANQNVLSDYLAITAARDLYNSNRSQPLNLTQFLNPSSSQIPTFPTPVTNNIENIPEPEANIEETPPEAFNLDEYIIFTTDEEDKAYINDLSPSEKARRRSFINKLNNNPTYRIKKQTIKDFNLAYQVQTIRPDIWEQIQNGTWAY